MTKIDQFESVFKSAAKVQFHHQALQFNKILVVTDLDDGRESKFFEEKVKDFLKGLEDEAEIHWCHLGKNESSSLGNLLERLGDEEADLICTYRHLHSDGWNWPYSLGEHLDVLTQATKYPILVMPRPEKKEFYENSSTDRQSVMAITDHLTGDDRLINFAYHFTAPGGTLYLSHVEDQHVFEYYMHQIEKIKEIDTETAHETILMQLLKEPKDYINSCRKKLESIPKTVSLQESISLGHRLSEYKKLIEEHSVDLLVFNTKDEDQLAMHGLAYPLAVELRKLPLLML